MHARTLKHFSEIGIHDGAIEELKFLAAWEGGLATSISAYLRVRQLCRAHPGLMMPIAPPPRKSLPGRRSHAVAASDRP